jgi:molybdate transport system ATP-binding protein
VSGAGLWAELETPLREFELAVELAARPGEPLALVGPSGAGKTSVLRILAGLLRPSRGRVGLGEQVWLDSERGVELPAERRHCGYVFQDYALFPRMSALRNVAYGAPGSRAERREAALTMLERFGIAGLAEAMPPTLSGGERQRVALARALAARPRALLLDEPLSALDSSTRRRALGELRAVLAELGAPVVLVTHSFDEAAVLAAELAIVDRGVIVQRGDAAAISATPASEFVADFAGAAVLRGEAEPGPAGELTLVRLAGGGAVRSTDIVRGPVAVCVYPWEVSLEPPGAAAADSIQNRVPAEVDALTTIGNRTRVALSLPQSLTAEVSADSARRMGLREGTRVTAAWKAAATRLVGGA